jgi:tRNA pseudouridine-54 N-methylase
LACPKKVEAFALRYGEKISLGKKPYLAASCITILNYLLDRKKNAEMSAKFLSPYFLF